MDRRGFLTGLVGCSLAASPLVTPVSFASVPGDRRLVVILLRGGMDGMGLVAPYGDPGYAALRGAPGIGPKGAADLDGFFALHRGARRLLPLWTAGELSFVHAVSTPYRDKRSHFDGQDLLEAGLGEGNVGQARDGWLNRLTGLLPGAVAETAYAVGNDPLAILNGPAPMTRWTPDADLALSPQAIRLAELVMRDDPMMSAALAEAFALAGSDGDGVAFDGDAEAMMGGMVEDMKAARNSDAVARMAEFAGKKLRNDAAIATFSINGWDTHARQDKLLEAALEQLSTAVLTLKEHMGAATWGKTVVAAVTEFGRTARLNGNAGTDHGTAGAMLLAGGALRGGKVHGDWPGLAEADLYARRDLMPTRDLRAHLGWLIRGLYGTGITDVERTIFPGLDMGADPGLLL
ncbi:MAG: DUF1501 domain-containing protein [Sagittula sp.]|uniref:DUF1501 domain-containing protein n=1 Tax=unclassified Sagittula TaxID=2624628 RepID=UPI000C2D585A|nr:DUF1501 domain-containing protein [Sagittula sp. P11]AUC53343.1 twin-arginine translocation pathway signal [Sagittula sp. P11]